MTDAVDRHRRRGWGNSSPPPWRATRALGELSAIDQAVYRAITATPSPTLDPSFRRLSAAADHAKLWLAIAGALALVPGRSRQAAVLGLTSVGLASATANLAAKPALRRHRPDRASATVPRDRRRVRMPASASLPSGHAASAFASAVGDALPLTALPLRLLAAAVAYSRVHTGVHYPADAVTGSLIGTGTAVAVRHLTRTCWRTR